MKSTISSKIKENIKLLSVPLILLAIYLSTYIIWTIFDLPKDKEMIDLVKGWFSNYGLWIVFFGAIIEGFLLLGQYFPGGFIIFLGVISAGKDIFRATEVVLIVCLSFFISYTLNYLVGKYGWYKVLVKFGLSKSLEESKEKLIKHELSAILYSYWEPNLASITATAAGVLKIPLKKFSFYSIIGILIWNTFWGIFVYTLGEKALTSIGLKYVLVIFVVWFAIILVKNFLSKNGVKVN
jgi:membrane-associated protein